MQTSLYLLIWYATGLATASRTSASLIIIRSPDSIRHGSAGRSSLFSDQVVRSAPNLDNIESSSSSKNTLFARATSSKSGSGKDVGPSPVSVPAPNSGPISRGASRNVSPSRNGGSPPIGRPVTPVSVNRAATRHESGSPMQRAGTAPQSSVGRASSKGSISCGSGNNQAECPASPARSHKSSPGESHATSFSRSRSPTASFGTSRTTSRSTVLDNDLLTPSERLVSLQRSYSAPELGSDYGRRGPGSPGSALSQAISSKASVAASSSSARTRFQSAGSDVESRISDGTRRTSVSSRLRHDEETVRGAITGSSRAHTTSEEPGVGSLVGSHRSYDGGVVEFSAHGRNKITAVATNESPTAFSRMAGTSSGYAKTKVQAAGGVGSLRADLPGLGKATATVTGHARSSMRIITTGDNPVTVKGKLNGEGDISVDSNRRFV